MNIRFLKDVLSSIDEIKVIGKSVILDGVACNVMGIVRRGMDIRLLILLYDERFQQRIEESEALEIYDDPCSIETNRMILSNDRRIDALNPFQSVLKVIIGERDFSVDYSEHQRLSEQDLENVLLITEFLNNGWQPDDVDYQEFDMLFLTSLKLEGDYTYIPDFNQNPEVRFIMGPRSIVHQVEKPVTLIVEGEYSEKLIFRDKTTGEEHWVQINRVYLMNVWEEMDKTFTNPKLLEHMTSEEIIQAKLDFENKFSDVCPKGMYFPVIEYESEEDISVQFHTKAFLDAKPVNRGSIMGFIIRPEQSTGILGFKLKAAVIQEPVPADINTIEAELFQCIHTLTDRDILIK